MPNPLSTRLRVVDLFCGAGGLSEGFRQAGHSIVAGVDHDPDAVATYAHNFPEAEAICGDIRSPEIRRQIIEIGTGCELVVGGPPCQAFSQVRNHVRIIDDPRNSLYREFVAIVKALQPAMFVMENVPGMDQLGVREQIAEDLTIGGKYRVRAKKLDAADFGVPQTRERLIFVGVRDDLGVDAPDIEGRDAVQRLGLNRQEKSDGAVYALAQGPSDLALALADPDDVSLTTVQQAIGDLAGLATGNRKDALPYSTLPKPASAYQRLMRDCASHILTNVQVPRMMEDTRLRLVAIPEGGNYRDLPEELQARYLTGQKWGQHNGTGKLTRKHYYAYRRLHSGIWAWTLNTKADAAYHYAVPRALSVREFARLQSFPDRFTFTTDPRKGNLPGRISGGPAHSRYRQVGNAVPPLLAYSIAVALNAALATSNESQEQSA